jgi:glycosyltransferase involved in cell wall biosynthesis
MRFGKNPLKGEGNLVEPPAEVTVGVLNCIPDQVGYFRGQLDSLRLCLASIRQHADRPFDLLVLDNGSCSEVRSFLENELSSGQLDYLILNNRNVGKRNGLLQILQSAPGNLIFYTDGDIYFRPGWMQAHLDIMETFPNVGLVGGVPSRRIAGYYTAGTMNWVEANKNQLIYEKGNLIPEEWTQELLRSIGFPKEDDSVEEGRHIEDCRVTFGGVTAFVGAGHMQFLARREVIAQLPEPRSKQAMGGIDVILDRVVEDAGWLRLSTDRPLAYHIGNVINEEWLIEEFERLVSDESVQLNGSSIARRRHWFWGRSRARQVLRWLYTWAFDLYSQNA